MIGIQYLVTTFVFFLIGGLLAEAFRAQLAKPGDAYFDGGTYNGLISTHASIMIFLFIIPAFAGIANFVVPLMLGAADMAFPRLNALSFWMLPTAGIMVVSSLCFGGGFNTGWTATRRSRTTSRSTSVLQHGRAVRGHLVDPDGRQLHRHDPDDARAGHDALAHAAARLGQPHDLAARRAGDAVHRGLAVHASCSTA